MQNVRTMADMYAIDKIIAIDPGAGGGIVIYSPNEELQVLKMTKKIKDFSDILKREKETTPNLLVVIEQVQVWKSDKDHGGKEFGIEKMKTNFNSLVSAMEINEVAHIKIHPITWQKGLNFKNQGDEKTKRKRFYKDWISKKTPGVKPTLWSADALCICEFTKRQIRYNMPWVIRTIPKNMLHNIRINNI